MAKTAAEVAQVALRILGVAPVGEAPSAEDAAVTKEHFTALLEELSDREDMDFPWTEDNVPEWAWPHLAVMLASRVAPYYGRGVDASGAYRALRRSVFDDDRSPRKAVPGMFY